MARKIDKLIIHCADTREDNLVTLKNEDMDVGAKEIEQWHADRATKEPWSPYSIGPNEYRFCGYHWVIRRNGVIEEGRPERIAGCHTSGHNSSSIAVCWIGRHRLTPSQKESLLYLCAKIMSQYDLNIKQVFGHTEFNPSKSCPNFKHELTFKTMDDFRSELEKCISIKEKSNGTI